MRTLTAKPLTRDAFYKYGNFCNLVPEELPDANLDQISLDLGRPFQNVAFSMLRIYPEKEIIAPMAERHDWTGQGILPLDGDVVIYVARPTASPDDCPVEKMEAFYVPKLTMITLNPGVWHFTPYSNKEVVNVMLTLPNRTWAHDVVFYGFSEEEKFRIVVE